MKKKMLVVRPVRETCLSFYKNFIDFEVDYVVASEKVFTTKVKDLPKDFRVKNLMFKPMMGIDPIKVAIKKTVHNLSWVYIEGIEELVKKCDVVNISDTYYFYNVQVIKLAKKYNKPVVTVIWKNTPRHISSWLPPYSFNTKTVVRGTDLFILRNKRAYEFTDSIGIDRSKAVMIYKGVDLDHFEPRKGRGDKRVEGESVKLLFVGSYEHVKGVERLVRVVERLVSKGFKVELVMAGSGSLSNLISRKAKNSTWLCDFGQVSYDELSEVYREADVFVGPCRIEYFSYVLLEAMASGLLIVSSRVGGVREEVGESNLLVGKNDAELEKALERVINDKELRLRIGKVNRSRAEKMFAAKKQARLTEQIIKERFNL